MFRIAISCLMNIIMSRGIYFFNIFVSPELFGNKKLIHFYTSELVHLLKLRVNFFNSRKKSIFILIFYDSD